MNHRKLDTILATLRRRLEEIYSDRLLRMVLYGSQARGEAEPGSDIDVLVVLKGPVNPGEEIARTGGAVADVPLGSGELVNCVYMDEERFEHRSGPFLHNIRRESISI